MMKLVERMLRQEAGELIVEGRPPKGQEGAPQAINDPRYVSNRLVEAHNHLLDAHAALTTALRNTAVIDTESKRKLHAVADTVLDAWTEVRGIRRDLDRANKLWSARAMAATGAKY